MKHGIRGNIIEGSGLAERESRYALELTNRALSGIIFKALKCHELAQSLQAIVFNSPFKTVLKGLQNPHAYHDYCIICK